MPDFKHPRPKVISFLMCTCPRCGKDKVFKYSPFKFTGFTDTKDACDNCKLDYAPEPGFFFGAMYWSYAILVGIIVIMAVSFNLLGIFDYAMYAIPATIILLLPFIFRYSRMLMLYVVYPIMFREKFD